MGSIRIELSEVKRLDVFKRRTVVRKKKQKRKLKTNVMMKRKNTSQYSK